MSTLTITLLQQPLLWLDGPANLSHFDAELETVRGNDLIVLPEMFTTRFAMNAAGNGLSQSVVETWLQEWAKETNALIGGSIAVSTPKGAVNHFVLVSPLGDIYHYDKRHLFRMANEHHHFEVGHERLIIEWRGWRILPQICYDLRFPVWSRNCQDYDLALYVANWPAPRAHHWRTLLAARAIENQAYVAGCNRVGADGNDHSYQGDIQIINPLGEIVARAPENQPAQISAELSLEALQSYREAFPAWRDADRFTL
ncbi:MULTISPECIES: amidohydrolase [Symbiopectobacterium]|uniref:amidohydrolase n=1 Tax=Symbiopectobacterium TaxID=801 RepID=UPI001A1EFEFB|nr:MULTISPECIES: amidohydrolase [Symbiopectobacterium]MBG6248776.1 amidohydrolase [Candidatus Symbiopectobacterium sp. PLON1]MBT9428720.1 amidohydrolase [Candidatus Symbiopectobacterium endolongispinus]